MPVTYLKPTVALLNGIAMGVRRQILGQWDGGSFIRFLGHSLSIHTWFYKAILHSEIISKGIRWGAECII